MIHNSLNHQELPIYGDGRYTRDWLFVRDHCRAIDMVFHHGRSGEVYNIGGNNERENLFIVHLILDTLYRLTGDANINQELIRHVTDRPSHDRRYGIDATKIHQELGWAPLVPFEEGIIRTIRWYLDNRPWTDKVTTGEYLGFYEKNYTNR
jgi:dTDP-glucose 4,6-dehydratase